MGRKKIVKIICTICGREECDGEEYILPTFHHMGVTFPKLIICSDKVFEKDGKFYHRIIHGHGDSSEVEVKKK